MAALERFNDLFDIIARIVHCTLIVGFLALVWFAADREPPFTVLRVWPASAAPGEEITIHVDVKRQIDRNCSARMSRSIFYSTQERTDLGTAHFSAQTIAAMERATPGRLHVNFVVPKGADPGPAALVSSLEYVCNATHRWVPIEMTTTMPFTILAP